MKQKCDLAQQIDGDMITCVPKSQPILARLVLPSTLTPCEDLLARKVSHTFKHATLFELTCHSLVDAVLYCVDIFVPGDFGFV